MNSGIRRTGRAFFMAFVALVFVTGCATTDTSGTRSGTVDGVGTMSIAVDRTAESRIMGQLYSQLLTAAGKEVRLEPGYATPADTAKAVTAGKVSLAPAYESALLRTMSGGQRMDGDMAATLSMALPPGVTALAPAPAQRADVFVVTRRTADRYKLRSIADLKKPKHRLVFGGGPNTDPELSTLSDVQANYGFTFGSIRTLDPAGPASRAALADGTADVVALLGTDPAIIRNHWVVLTDPQQIMPSERVFPLISAPYADLATRKALAKINKALTTKELAALTTAENPEQAARDWLESHRLVRF